MSDYKKAKHSHNEGYSVLEVFEIVLLILGGILSVIAVVCIVIAVLMLVTA